MTHPLRTLLYELFIEPIVDIWQQRWPSPLPVLETSSPDASAGAPPLRSRFWSDRVGGSTSSLFTADLDAIPVASVPPASTSEERPKESYD